MDHKDNSPGMDSVLLCNARGVVLKICYSTEAAIVRSKCLIERQKRTMVAYQVGHLRWPPRVLNARDFRESFAIAPPHQAYPAYPA